MEPRMSHMKRPIFILFILANSLLLFAQSSMPDLHKQMMIEDINYGKYENAAQEIIHVKDWTFDENDERDYVDVNNAQVFINHIDTNDVLSISLRDSMLFYILNQCNILGYYQYCVENYSEAIQYIESEVKIIHSALGENHPGYTSSLYNLGLIYFEMGDYTSAEQYFTQSLAIKKNTLGENHPDYVSSLETLGLLYYYNVLDYARAEKYILQSLAIKKNTLGENHPDYATSITLLGNLYSEMGDYDKAEKYLIQALAIRQNTIRYK